MSGEISLPNVFKAVKIFAIFLTSTAADCTKYEFRDQVHASQQISKTSWKLPKKERGKPFAWFSVVNEYLAWSNIRYYIRFIKD